jgi:hypothetical protein
VPVFYYEKMVGENVVVYDAATGLKAKGLARTVAHSLCGLRQRSSTERTRLANMTSASILL